jgi:hypothetical protein
MLRTTATALLSALALALAAAPSVRADTFVLDTSTGAHYDAVGDGWLFAGGIPPNGLPPDGIGDAGNNALAVGYIAGLLEERGMAEFPLAPLTGLTATQIQSATLTFFIDYVISTFGPGANFGTTASDPIAVYHYPADGTVTIADFSPAGLSQIGLVNPGVVTNASLVVSGPLEFNLDVTDELKDALTNGDAAFGALFGTLDSGSATSLDGLSPPGVPGATLPVITIETIALQPPVMSKPARGCQALIAKAGAAFVTSELRSFRTCFNLILKDWAPDQILSESTTTKCADELDASNAESKLAKAATTFTTKVLAKCDGLMPADIASPCDPAATDIAVTTACVLAGQRSAAEAQIGDQYGSSCTLLDAVGLDAGFPGLCTP